jgi:hypothetical protein
MKLREKPHTDKYKAITNDSDDDNCTPTLSLSPPDWGLEYFDRFIFVAQIVHSVHHMVS